jgi:hypothetical protein
MSQSKGVLPNGLYGREGTPCAPRASQNARIARFSATPVGAQRTARPTFAHASELGNTRQRRLLGFYPGAVNQCFLPVAHVLIRLQQGFQAVTQFGCGVHV